MTIADFLKEIWTSSKERLKSPFLGTFTISWLALNYRLLLVVFSEKGVAYKLQYIQGYHDWCNSLLYPLISATCILVLPKFILGGIEFITKWIDWKRDSLNNLSAIRRKRWSRVSAKIDKDIALIQTGETDIKVLEKQNKDLRSENTKLETDLEQLKTKSKITSDSEQSLTFELNDSENTIKRLNFEIAELRVKDSFNALVSEFNESQASEVRSVLEKALISEEKEVAEFIDQFKRVTDPSKTDNQSLELIKLGEPFPFNLTIQKGSNTELSKSGQLFKSLIDLQTAKKEYDPKSWRSKRKTGR